MFPGNRTHNLCAANAMLYNWATGTLTTNMSSNVLNRCVYRAAADTFVNDFTWTHYASGLFNTTWILYMLLLMRKHLKPRCTPFPGNMSFNPETIAKRCLSLNVPRVSISSWCDAETLLKPEMIFVNPVFKFFHHLTNDWYLCECPQNCTICTYI